MKCGGICGVGSIRKNIRHLRRHKMEDLFSHTHMLRQFQSGENERWISYSRWMLITVFYGGNAITRYCFLSREPCKFMRLEIWNNEAWHGMSVPSTHLPLSKWWGKLISLLYFLLTVSETRPWPMSLHLPPSILYSGYAVNLRFKMEVQRSLSAYDIKGTKNRNNMNRVWVSRSSIFFFYLEKWGLE